MEYRVEQSKVLIQGQFLAPGKNCSRFLGFEWAGGGGVLVVESALLDLYSLNQVFEVTVGRVVKDHVFHSLYLTDMEAEAQEFTDVSK